MELLIILLFIIIIALILSHQRKILNRFDYLEEDLRQLRDQLRDPRPIADRPVQPIPRPAPTASDAPPVPQPPKQPVPTATPIQQPATPPKQPPRPAPVEKKGFFERHPDLEKFIGENLVSKIGIAILVLAIGFFVKYEIDNGQIGPAGRVAVGLLCGAILIVLAHKLRKGYTAFSSVLVGGGLAIFYFTIALAFHQYGMFPQSVAFIIMLFITAFAVILSILYNRQELAIIALAGGFIAPFIASNGSGNYQVLFTYLLILNTGLLIIAYNKAWRLLNLLAFLFTALLFISWTATLPYNTPFASYRGGLLFATAFYILFFLINIAYTIRENKKFIASDFGILLGNTCFYFAMGLWLLTEMDLDNYRGLFSASMGIFNLAGSYFLLRTKKVDRNILYLLIGITLSFVSLTAPLQLHGHYITLFWASETVLLYWLSQRSGIRIIRWASMLIWMAMIVSLMMDWAELYGKWLSPHDRPLPILFNKGFMTGLYASICCYAAWLISRKEEKAMTRTAGSMDSGIINQMPTAFLIVGSLLFFSTGALEINYQFMDRYPGSELNTLYLLLYTFGFISLLTFLGGRFKWFGNPWIIPGMLIACIVIYIFFIPDSFRIQSVMLEEGRYRSHFTAHWISALLIASILYRLIAARPAGKWPIDPTLATWIICILVVTFLSSEIQLLINTIFYSKAWPLTDIQQVYYKTGLPILWGLCSFAFMWLGMRHKFKPLRILSLVLFTITLLKLFLFDIRNIPIAGKIAAFFCLGILLLVVSFMYQRLKKIIVDEEKKVI